MLTNPILLCLLLCPALVLSGCGSGGGSGPKKEVVMTDAANNLYELESTRVTEVSNAVVVASEKISQTANDLQARGLPVTVAEGDRTALINSVTQLIATLKLSYANVEQGNKTYFRNNAECTAALDDYRLKGLPLLQTHLDEFSALDATQEAQQLALLALGFTGDLIESNQSTFNAYTLCLISPQLQ